MASSVSASSASGSDARRRRRRSSVSSEMCARTVKPRAISSVSARESARRARSKRVTKPAISSSQSRRRCASASSGDGRHDLLGELDADRQPRLEGIGLAGPPFVGDALEPAPAIAHHAPRHCGRAGPRFPARVLDALHETPALELGEGQGRRPVAEAQGFPDVALGEQVARDEQVAVHAGHGGSDVPGRAHVAPGVGEGDADVLGRGSSHLASAAWAQSACEGILRLTRAR